jgi:hypothetical protein
MLLYCIRMEYIDQYVYVNAVQATAMADPDRRALKVILNYSTDRVPYALVEVLSLSLRVDNDNGNHYTLKVEEMGQNYLGHDNRGTALAIAPFNSSIKAAHFVYTMLGTPAKVMFGNARELTFYIEDEDGVRESVGDAYPVESYTMMLKVSYPKTGEIAPAYRSQIPL